MCKMLRFFEIQLITIHTIHTPSRIMLDISVYATSALAKRSLKRFAQSIVGLVVTQPRTSIIYNGFETTLPKLLVYQLIPRNALCNISILDGQNTGGEFFSSVLLCLLFNTKYLTIED